ncbi:MAG TPA: site-specific integrase, partial [Solirubrobacteraceae bacterium]|nr:site-specific integrase [Solirubrobacteraceae bacterium]
MRDRALFTVLCRTGMWISEALNLRKIDLHKSTGFIRIRRGRKNDRGRDVVMFGSADSPTYGCDQLRPWIEKRAELGIPRPAPLFCTYSLPNQGKKLGSSQIRDALKRYVRKAELPGRFHVHGFRHTLAAELYRGDVKLARIKHQLGHSSLAITQTYLEDVLGIPKAIDEL